MNAKSILASKTFYAFVATLLGTWAAYFSGAMDLQAAVAASVQSVMGIGLRLITTQPVTLPGTKS